MPNPVVAWQIDTAEPAKILEFYGNVFEWELGPPGHVQYVDTKSAAGIGGSVHALQPEDDAVRLLLCVTVEDINGILDLVSPAGGTVEGEPHELPDGRMVATIRDPSGNWVRVYQMPAEGAAD